jgi:hypothetical protein
MDRVRLLVNGRWFVADHLRPAEHRVLDVSSAMRKGSDNTVWVLAQGARNGSAVILASDS